MADLCHLGTLPDLSVTFQLTEFHPVDIQLIYVYIKLNYVSMQHICVESKTMLILDLFIQTCIIICM